jgi:uncharacterized membrane-anchored protein YhcB (DUF1043 family)
MQIAVGGGLVAAGFVIGLIASRFGGSPKARARRLEQELRAEQTRGKEYQDAVARHFGDTAERFRTLTEQYTALYSHLARGAQDLCSDRLTALGHEFDKLALPGTSESESQDPAGD